MNMGDLAKQLCSQIYMPITRLSNPKGDEKR